MTLPTHPWHIKEDFDTDPSPRRWIQGGPGTPSKLDWNAGQQAVGDHWGLTSTIDYNTFTRAILTHTQQHDLLCRVKFQHDGIDFFDYASARFGFFNSATDIRYDNVTILVARRSFPYPPADLPNHGFFIQVKDTAGTVYTSSPSAIKLKTADFPKTYYLELYYDADAKSLSLDIYDSGGNFLEQLTLIVPSAILFAINEIGTRTKDYGSPQNVVSVLGWMRQFYMGWMLPPTPPFVGQGFKVLIDGVEFKYWSSFNFGGSQGSLRGVGINVPNPRGKHTGRFHVNQEVEIQYQGVNEPTFRTVYKGLMDNPTNSVQGKNGQIVLSGRDSGVPLTDEKCVDGKWVPYLSLTGVDPFDIATFVVSNLKTPLEIAPGSQRNAVPIPITYDFDRQKWCIDVIKKMAEYGNYEWFITQDGKFMMRPPKELIDANISKVYILGTKADFIGSLPNDNVGYIVSENVGEDGTDIVNSMGLQGKDKFVYHTDQASVDAHRLRHDYIEDDGLASDQLQQIVIGMVDLRKKSRRSFSFATKGTFEIDRGDIIWIDDKSYGFSGQPGKLYKIVGKTDNVSKNGFTSTLQLADKPLKVSDVMALF